jgi:hypothetical protein
MNCRRTALTGLALAATLLIPVGVAQAAPALASQGRQTVAGLSSSHELYREDASPGVAAGTRHGCPYGDACMYTTSGWNNNTPEHEYYYYACYNLSNELGKRVIYNNQYGGADIAGYSRSGCSAVNWVVGPGGSLGVDITPIYSVRLYCCESARS